MISAECFSGPAPVAMLNTLSGLWELSALWRTRKWAKCLVLLLSNGSLQSLNCVPFQDSSLCVFDHLCHDPSFCCRFGGVKSGTRCSGELAVIDALSSWSPASYESGHCVACGSGQILFWGLLLHSAELRGILHICDLLSPVEFSSNWSSDSRVIPPVLTHT